MKWKRTLEGDYECGDASMMNRILAYALTAISQSFCRHAWTRFRTLDGEYTLRCWRCAKVHAGGWRAIVGAVAYKDASPGWRPLEPAPILPLATGIEREAERQAAEAAEVMAVIESYERRSRFAVIGQRTRRKMGGE